MFWDERARSLANSPKEYVYIYLVSLFLCAPHITVPRGGYRRVGPGIRSAPKERLIYGSFFLFCALFWRKKKKNCKTVFKDKQKGKERYEKPHECPGLNQDPLIIQQEFWRRISFLFFLYFLETSYFAVVSLDIMMQSILSEESFCFILFLSRVLSVLVT